MCGVIIENHVAWQEARLPEPVDDGLTEYILS